MPEAKAPGPSSEPHSRAALSPRGDTEPGAMDNAGTASAASLSAAGSRTGPPGEMPAPEIRAPEAVPVPGTARAVRDDLVHPDTGEGNTGEAHAAPDVRRSKLSGQEEAQLLSRADTLLRQGQIVSARLWLERGVRDGSAAAAYRLAETYDPRVLRQWGAIGVPGDRARARDLYAQAHAAGFEPARERLTGLD